MGLISWIKGKMKQREVRKLEPDEDFSFEENYYGTEILEGFKFLYCNNYTHKLYDQEQFELTFISCVISLPKTVKNMEDLIVFLTNYYDRKLYQSFFDYKHIMLKMIDNKINLYLRGDILFYSGLCDIIHNNIITKYIRNNIFPDGLPIGVPNEYLNNLYNSINHPSKETDILFIEDNYPRGLSPIIGLSLSPKSKMSITDYKYLECNGRHIFYIEIGKLLKSDLIYLMNEVKYCNLLKDIVHKYIDEDDIDSDIDEIIE